jgi:hypothetical protein
MIGECAVGVLDRIDIRRVDDCHAGRDRFV